MMMAPTTIMLEPKKIVFRRPNGSPIQIVHTAPKKHPTLYAATAIPWITARWGLGSAMVSISGKVFLYMGRYRQWADQNHASEQRQHRSRLTND